MFAMELETPLDIDVEEAMGGYADCSVWMLG